MSGDGTQIVCRRCGERIPMEGGSCPHCGTKIRGVLGPGVMIVLGLVVGVASLLGTRWFYVAVGLLTALAGGYLVYERRQRIREANRRSGTDAFGQTDEDVADVE